MEGPEVLMDVRDLHPVVGHFLVFYGWKEQREVRRPNRNGYPYRWFDLKAVQLLYWQSDHPSVVAKQQKTSVDRTLGHSDHPEPVQ